TPHGSHPLSLHDALPISVPSVAGGDEGEYVLRVRGDSMKDAGILEGDMVVVHSQETARDGDVVVALLGEEATVKRFYREPDHIRSEEHTSELQSPYDLVC